MQFSLVFLLAATAAAVPILTGGDNVKREEDTLIRDVKELVNGLRKRSDDVSVGGDLGVGVLNGVLKRSDDIVIDGVDLGDDFEILKRSDDASATEDVDIGLLDNLSVGKRSDDTEIGDDLEIGLPIVDVTNP